MSICRKLILNIFFVFYIRVGFKVYEFIQHRCFPVNYIKYYFLPLRDRERRTLEQLEYRVSREATGQRENNTRSKFTLTFKNKI